MEKYFTVCSVSDDDDYAPTKNYVIPDGCLWPTTLLLISSELHVTAHCTLGMHIYLDRKYLYPK